MISDIRYWEKKASEGHYDIMQSLILMYGMQRC